MTTLLMVLAAIWGALLGVYDLLVERAREADEGYFGLRGRFVL